MTQSKDGHTGGCLCGAVHYRAEGAPDWVGHCHCRSCRRNSGAAMLTFAGYTQDRITWTKGRRQIFESSPGVRRGFCGRCGTPITYEADSYGARGACPDGPRLDRGPAPLAAHGRRPAAPRKDAGEGLRGQGRLQLLLSIKWGLRPTPSSRPSPQWGEGDRWSMRLPEPSPPVRGERAG